MIYTVTLNPSVDYFLSVKDFKSGIINRSDNEYMLPGGKGVNVSIVLKNLGIHTVATGFVAGETGSLFSSLLSCQGVESDFIQLKEGNTRINVKVKSEAETEINASGPNIDDEAYTKLLEKFSDLSMSDMVVVAGSVPESLGQERYLRLLDCISRTGAALIVDTTGKNLTDSLKFKPFLIKPNDAELGEIFGTECNSTEKIAECAGRLRESGAQNVLVSRGAAGAVLFCSNFQVFDCPAPEGDVVSTVGSGDSTVAGFVAGYMESGDYEYALKLGVSAGSASAFTPHLASHDEIMRIFEEIKNCRIK